MLLSPYGCGPTVVQLVRVECDCPNELILTRLPNIASSGLQSPESKRSLDSTSQLPSCEARCVARVSFRSHADPSGLAPGGFLRPSMALSRALLLLLPALAASAATCKERSQ